MRKKAWYAALLVLCLLLAGCGKTAGKTGDDPQIKAQTEPVNDSDASVKLKAVRRLR